MERAVGVTRFGGLRPVLEVVASRPAAACYERSGRELLGVVDQHWGPDHVVSLHCYAEPVSAPWTE